MNHNTEKMFTDWYLKHNDKPDYVPDSMDKTFMEMKQECSDSSCIFHRMVVVSTVAQKVWVQLHTYGK